MEDSKIIRSICFKIAEELDPNLLYTESNYQTLLMKRLGDAGFQVAEEVEVLYRMQDRFPTGRGYIDILCETASTVFVIELKANNTKWGKGLTQLKRYLTHWESDKIVRGMFVAYKCHSYKPVIFDEFGKPSNAKILPNYPKRTDDAISKDPVGMTSEYYKRDPAFQNGHQIVGSRKLSPLAKAPIDRNLNGIDSDLNESKGNTNDSGSELTSDSV